MNKSSRPIRTGDTDASTRRNENERSSVSDPLRASTSTPNTNVRPYTAHRHKVNVKPRMLMRPTPIALILILLLMLWIATSIYLTAITRPGADGGGVQEGLVSLQMYLRHFLDTKNTDSVAKAEELVDMRKFSATLAFDDSDGGVGKQGRDVESKQVDMVGDPKYNATDAIRTFPEKDDLSKVLADAARSGHDKAVTEENKHLFAEIERQAKRGLNPSVSHLPVRVQNNLLRAQATGNDLYFELAEKDMDEQWNSTVKPNLPSDGDYSYVLEIAPGHGRNTNKLKDISGKIVGVDINPDNIAFLQNRFVGNSNLSFYQTDGVTIPKEIKSGVSFVYCFDAMVHFDKEVINAYLLEIGRLMRPGATGFIHHSQTPECPKTLENGFCSNPDIIGNDQKNPHQRNAYSKEEFAKMAKLAGLTIINQVDMVWEPKYGASDAISTFQKPLVRESISENLK